MPVKSRVSPPWPAMSASDLLARTDPELWDAISLENRRQEDHVELIASENYVSPAVLAAQGSQLTNKYAEGYPGKRYYGGCEYVDIVETLAIERAKKLFGADWANVQPHSGSQANQAVYVAVLKPGDTVLGMSLAHGGHLTHGSPVNLSGKLYRLRVLRPGREGGDRLRRGRAPGARAPAEADRHRRLRLLAAHRLAALPRHRGPLRRAADGGHRALRGHGGGGAVPVPHRRGALRHQHHAQDAARPARRPGARNGRITARPSTRRSFPACRAGR